jgi:hypothetical protein
MNERVPATILAVCAAALLLTGCAGRAEAGPTVSASNIATTAENALEKKVGTRPAIDCGSKDVILVVGKSIVCDLTDPSSGDIYDVEVTVSQVRGSKYHIDTKVARSPKSTGKGGDPKPSGTPGAVTVPGTTIASLAANALAGQLGFTPDVVCADDRVPIFPGSVANCSYSAQNVEHDVQVTITDFDGENYKINAKIVS